MPTQRYTVTQPYVETLFVWIRSGEIAVPEIQRPFVWDATMVRDLLDSLFKGFPVGYLITWKNPNTRLKDGTSASGKRILIDGQQRVTALMAAILGHDVVNKDYETERIKIAYLPSEQRFEVCNAILAKDKQWIPDIAAVFDPASSVYDLVTNYCAKNPELPRDIVSRSIEMLRGITSNQLGMIELAPDLDIETVTKIFIRVNSMGVSLSQADFVMSKIAANEAYGGHVLRKAIDYFCHMVVVPEFYKTAVKDTAFASTEYLPQMAWLKGENDDIYDPSYTDMLHVAFASEFRRGKLADLVALLSGRNFETKENMESIVEDSFRRLSHGVMQFMNETDFKRFVLIIRSAGFVDATFITSQNALNFAYILYLTLRAQKRPASEIEARVRRWFVLSMLTGRYSGSTETMFEEDIRAMDRLGVSDYCDIVERGVLSDAFWNVSFPQQLETSSISSPNFRVFEAAQVKLGDLGFLSHQETVKDLIEVKSDVHHLFPRDLLKKHGYTRGQYNQVANYAIAQSEVNMAIGNKEPGLYFSQAFEQCNGGKMKYGGIVEKSELRANLSMHCIPEGVENMTLEDYPLFLERRRKLMAEHVKTYFNKL